ncbi:hypothetical protein KBD45_04845 [Candidatus Dojkabacteria bacterium]|nr:hypothetical protein [Candidatus Dojkabacteria bacterium]
MKNLEKKFYNTLNIFDVLIQSSNRASNLLLDFLVISIKNDLRNPNNHNGLHQLLLKKYSQPREQKTSTAKTKYIQEVLKDLSVDNELIRIQKLTKTNFGEIILKTINSININFKNESQRQLIFNLILVRNGLIPCMFFLFNKQYSLRPNTIGNIFEISLHYFTKLIHTETMNKDILSTSKLIGKGASNLVYLDEIQNLIYKVPNNFLTFKYINKLEYEINKMYIKTKLKEFVNINLKYLNKTHVLSANYYRGESGHELLIKNEFQYSSEMINSLRDFYKIYTSLTHKIKIKLDIHPGNFIWNKEKLTWVLIDFGPIPEIGSNYFPLDSFDKYLKRVWLDRPKLMKEVPIRSVDLGY